MINKVIRGFTRILGKPLDWKAEDHGKCGALAVLDLEEDVMKTGVITNSMISAWELTPDELRKLKMGAAVYLRVLGTMHPPVAIWVGDPPIDGMEPSDDDLEQFRQAIHQELANFLAGGNQLAVWKESEEMSHRVLRWYRAGRILD